MIESSRIDEFTEVPKSDNPYVKLLVRLYKFLSRKLFRAYRIHRVLTSEQAEPTRPSTRLSFAVS